MSRPAPAAHAADRPPIHTSRRIALGLIVLLALLVSPAPASGHAALETISPADQSSGPAPTEIVGTFAENLDPSKSSFTLLDASGAVVATGGEVAGDDVRKMTLTLTSTLAPGAYTIRWTTFSTEDKELARGTTTFTVVAANPSPPAASVEPSAAPSPSVVESVAPSVVESVAPSVAPSPSPPPTTPAASTSDALIPIVAVLAVVVGLGLWLLRGRARRGA